MKLIIMHNCVNNFRLLLVLRNVPNSQRSASAVEPRNSQRSGVSNSRKSANDAGPRLQSSPKSDVSRLQSCPKSDVPRLNSLMVPRSEGQPRSKQERSTRYR